MSLYKVVRFFLKSEDTKVIKHFLTRKEAQDHCNDPETSSKTCKLEANKKIKRSRGAWFDGFYEYNTDSNWLEHFADEKSPTVLKQNRFEKIVLLFITKEGLNLSKHCDHTKENKAKTFSFALFGASNGLFKISQYFQGLDHIDERIQSLRDLDLQSSVFEEIKLGNVSLETVVLYAMNIYKEIK